VDSKKRRELGSYYTSQDTANYMANWLLQRGVKTVLEPTAGDGVFIEALQKVARSKRRQICITAVEIHKEAYSLIKQSKSVKALHMDFHRYQGPEVDATIGNPPFVRFRNLKKVQAADAEVTGRKLIGKKLDVSGSIWMTIVMNAVDQLKVGGRAAFVIPTDALYVRYARPFWDFLGDRFGSVKIVRCRERLFPEILQDVVLLFVDAAGSSSDEIVCLDFKTMKEMFSGENGEESIVKLIDVLNGSKPFMKANLSNGNQLWISKLNHSTQPAINLIKFNIGYVSGNKNFFHPSYLDIDQYSLPASSLRPAIVTARKLARSGAFTSSFADNTELLWLPNPTRLSEGEKKYITEGEKKGFGEGHKTSKRDPWYVVPGVVQPDVVLTVFGDLPRMMINDANMPASNSILVGHFREAIEPDEFLMLWYSSVTRLGIELSVHSLGGGVLVLVPREGDAILMPKPSGDKVPRNLIKNLNNFLKVNDLEGAYSVGDQYLQQQGWKSQDLKRCLKIAKELRALRSRTN